MSPSELSSSSSNSDTPSSSDVKNRGEFESILKKSMERQSALEAEVGQLKSLVSCMMSKMENMSSPTAHLTSQPSSMLSSVNSTSTCSIDSLVQSDNDLKRRRWESSDDNDDDGDDSNSDDGLTSKRIKENQPLPLTTPFVEETSSSSSSSSSSAIESVTVRGGEGLEQ
jgi:hypothetical protein